MGHIGLNKDKESHLFSDLLNIKVVYLKKTPIGNPLELVEHKRTD